MGSTPLGLLYYREKHEKEARELVGKWQASGSGQRTLADAREAVAHEHDFDTWAHLIEWVEAAGREGSPVACFESAVEAVVAGDEPELRKLMRETPSLVRARSTRAPHFEAPVHRATLLHYVAANGVERSRQKTPKNAVAIATILFDAGAEVDALASMYGGEATTMNMLVSSDHPAFAGVEIGLVETLLDHGAAVDGPATSVRTPLFTALAFGHSEAAEVLARRGASVDTLAAAAGLGRRDLAAAFLPAATAEERHRALALATQHGQSEIVAILLDAGEDPNRYNPPGNHAHSTPLHQAALGGHLAAVQLLVDRGARLDQRDKVYHGSPLGWAEHGGRAEVAAFLRSRRTGPKID
ncbi:MAG TPA: ankyrin repeat domain-containing protein [Polyangiaceae bacterium]|jgi:ankyrin repeat protein|nr:ankyrin repeat domain-containing protein [Polyangiaceae bacterium]